MGVCRFTLLLFCVSLVRCQYELKPVSGGLLEPQGLSLAYPADPGVTLFAVHYSINKPVHGVNVGDHNYDVTSPTGNLFVHDNPNVVVNIGDTVNYWYYVLHEGLGYQRTDQSWTAGAGQETTAPATAPPPTTPPVTQPQTTQPSTQPPTQPPTPPPGGSTLPPTQGPTQAPPDPECDTYPCLIFEDNFDTLDIDTWEQEITSGGGGNWEFQYYTNNRTNSYVKDGVLYLKPTLTSDRFDETFLATGTLDLWGSAPPNMCTGNAFWGCSRTGTNTNFLNPVQSARLRSIHSFSFKYGKVEVQAQMPRGDWIWPAIWMLPKHEFYGQWPSSGEIDIVESRGNLDYKTPTGESKGHDHMGSTLHWGPFLPYNGWSQTTASRDGNFGVALNKYTVEWDETSIKSYLNDVLIMTADPGANGFWNYGGFDTSLPGVGNPWANGENKMAPFDKEFYLIMNVAVGGTGGYFPDSWVNTPYPKPWLDTSGQAFKDFYAGKDNWYPTWNPTVNNGEDAAMKVDYVRVWKMKA